MTRQHISSADGLGPCWCRPKIVVPGSSPEYLELSRILGEMGGAAELLEKFTVTTKPEVSYERP